MYLLTYDIRQAQRLRRIARHLERHAFRVQFSVFLYFGSERQLVALLDRLALLMDLQTDSLEAFPLMLRDPALSRGARHELEPAATIVGPDVWLTLPSAVQLKK
jgi:CRISPR-associated endonuclease Cas2